MTLRTLVVALGLVAGSTLVACSSGGTGSPAPGSSSSTTPSSPTAHCSGAITASALDAAARAGHATSLVSVFVDVAGQPETPGSSIDVVPADNPVVLAGQKPGVYGAIGTVEAERGLLPVGHYVLLLAAVPGKYQTYQVSGGLAGTFAVRADGALLGRCAAPGDPGHYATTSTAVPLQQFVTQAADAIRSARKPS